MVNVRMGEHVQSMGGQTATVVFGELIASVIAMIAIWLETAAVDQPGIVKRVHWRGLG
jgi:hypothetical protein